MLKNQQIINIPTYGLSYIYYHILGHIHILSKLIIKIYLIDLDLSLNITYCI
jgi:hypothetical protein